MDIDAYLDELSRHLQVIPLRRDEIRLEVHTHLAARKDHFVREGMDASSAEDCATAEFGAPSTVASMLSCLPSPLNRLRESNQWVRTAGSLYMILGWLLTGYALAYLTENYFQLAEMPPAEALGYIGVSVLGILWFQLSGLAVMRQRRWGRLAALCPLVYTLPMLTLTLLNLKEMKTLFFAASAIMGLAAGFISLYMLWALMHPRSRQLKWK